MKEITQFNNYVNSIVEAAPAWKDVYTANKGVIADPNKIYPGQKLTLPGGGTYTVKPGDSLSKIAQSTGQSSGQGAKRTTPKAAPATPAQPEQPSKLPSSQQKAQSQLQTADDFVRAMANAATFGYADKAAAWLASKTGGKDYETELGKEYGKSAAAGQRSPIASTAGEITGMVASPAFAGGAKLTAAGLSKLAPQAGNLSKFVAGTAGGLAADTAAEKIAQKADPNNPWLKEGNKKMKSKEFLRKTTQEGKAGAFGKIVSQLGGGAEALPASTLRKSGKTFDKVRGVDSELKYVSRTDPKDIKSLDDIKKIDTKPPAVWRKGGDTGVSSAASKTAGAVDDVAATAAKSSKPLSRTASTLAGAAGGGLIGYGLASGEKGEAPMPTPPDAEPGPSPTPQRPSPPRPTPAKPESEKPAYDNYQPRSDDSDNNDSSDYRRYKPGKSEPVKPEPVKPDASAAGKEEPSVTAARAAAAQKMAELQRMMDLSKAARERPGDLTTGQSAKPSADNTASTDQTSATRSVRADNPFLPKVDPKIAAWEKLSPEQQAWMGKADPTDPYILSRMRRAVPDRAPEPSNTDTQARKIDESNELMSLSTLTWLAGLTKK